MIRAELNDAGVPARLAGRAAALAERRRRTDDQHTDDWRWRSARWLWPLFADRPD